MKIKLEVKLKNYSESFVENELNKVRGNFDSMSVWLVAIIAAINNESSYVTFRCESKQECSDLAAILKDYGFEVKRIIEEEM